MRLEVQRDITALVAHCAKAYASQEAHLLWAAYNPPTMEGGRPGDVGIGALCT